MANPFVHVELTTPDVAKSKRFYSNLFNWQLQDVNMGVSGEYTMIEVGDGIGGGMFTMPGAPAMWLPYVQVDDVEAATKKAKALGASIMRDITEIPGVGTLSIISDPTGAMLGLWQSKKPT